ncbi:MAG TPA: hypothetical protein VGO95_02590 [Modestobacter sp.]|nr:hypothetical protein [Modestobacter sp.]
MAGCLAAAVLAARLPEAPRPPATGDGSSAGEDPGWGAVLRIPLSGAAGSALGGRATTWRPRTLTAVLACSGAALLGAALLGAATGLVAVAAGYALYGWCWWSPGAGSRRRSGDRPGRR